MSGDVVKGDPLNDDEFDEPTEPSVMMPLPASPSSSSSSSSPEPEREPAPPSSTLMRPPMSLPPPRQSSSTTASRHGGLAVHRAVLSLPGQSPIGPDEAVESSLPVVRPEVAEALAKLKPASSMTSGSLPVVRPGLIVPATVKTEVQEALAALKPAAPSAMTSTSLPPLRPTAMTIETSAPTSRAETSASVRRAGFQWPVTPPLVKKVAWGVVFSTTAALTLLMLPPPAPSVAAMADLPVVTLSSTAMPCEALTSRRGQLECRLSRRRFFAMATSERTSRLAVTLQLARAGNFERVVFVDVGGTWARHSTDPAVTPPKRARVKAIDLAPSTPPPSSTPPR